MSNEATVSSGLVINKNSLQYQSRPASHRVDVTGTKGPTPGALAVAVTGVNVDLSQLTTPGLCRITNLESSGGNYVMVGKYDGTSFHPLMEVGPGESYVIKLYRYLSAEWVGTGTPADVNTMRLMADTAAVNVLVEAFEK